MTSGRAISRALVSIVKGITIVEFLLASCTRISAVVKHLDEPNFDDAFFLIFADVVAMRSSSSTLQNYFKRNLINFP